MCSTPTDITTRTPAADSMDGGATKRVYRIVLVDRRCRETFREKVVATTMDEAQRMAALEAAYGGLEVKSVVELSGLSAPTDCTGLTDEQDEWGFDVRPGVLVIPPKHRWVTTNHAARATPHAA